MLHHDLLEFHHSSLGAGHPGIDMSYVNQFSVNCCDYVDSLREKYKHQRNEPIRKHRLYQIVCEVKESSKPPPAKNIAGILTRIFLHRPVGR